MSSVGVDEHAPASGLRRTDLTSRKWVSIALWRVPQLFVIVGVIWPDGIGPLWTVGFTWIGAACTANAFRCGRVHCSIMGPLLLVLGLVSLTNTLGIISIGWTVIGVAALAVVALAFTPELLGRKYFGNRLSCDTE